MNLKQKHKSYFKVKHGSDLAVELLRMFILPFMKVWNPLASVDDAVAAFFAVEDRKIYTGIAKRAFKMPGHVFLAGNRPVPRFGPKDIAKGTHLVLAIDRKEQSARVDVTIGGNDRTFLLARHELEYIKDYIDVKEA